MSCSNAIVARRSLKKLGDGQGRKQADLRLEVASSPLSLLLVYELLLPPLDSAVHMRRESFTGGSAAVEQNKGFCINIAAAFKSSTDCPHSCTCNSCKGVGNCWIR